jgi:hypothetical protein
MSASERSQAIKFFKDHVIGKTLVAAPITTVTDQGRTEGHYETQTFFSNLVETANGFHFDLTDISRGTLYLRGADGATIRSDGSLHAVRVYRYEITERKSSGKLVGFARCVTSTNTEPDPVSGTISLVRMWLEDEALVVEETQAGYADFPGASGVANAVASDGVYRYRIEEGKLEMRYQQTTFDVDPTTLRRTRTADEFPEQVSREIEFYVLDA